MVALALGGLGYFFALNMGLLAGRHDEAGQQAPATAGAPQEETAEPPAQAAAPVVPSLDIVRVEPDGSAVVAGRASPRATVRLLSGERMIGETQANAAGEWVIVPDKPLQSGATQINITSILPDGTELPAEETIVVEITGERNRRPLVVVTRGNMPSEVMQLPDERPLAEGTSDDAAEEEQRQVAEAAPEQGESAAASTSGRTGEEPQADSGSERDPAETEHEMAEVEVAENRPQTPAGATADEAEPEPGRTKPQGGDAASGTGRTGAGEGEELDDLAEEQTEPAAEAEGMADATQQTSSAEEQPATSGAAEQGSGATEMAETAAEAARTNRTEAEPRKNDAAEKNEIATAKQDLPQSASAVQQEDPASQQRDSGAQPDGVAGGEADATVASGSEAEDAGEGGDEARLAGRDEAASQQGEPGLEHGRSQAGSGASDQSEPDMATVPASDSEPSTAEEVEVPARTVEGETSPDAVSRPVDDAVRVQTVESDSEGRFFATGEAEPGSTVRVYVDNQLVGDTMVDAAGRWQLVTERQLSPGEYDVRVDQVTSQGQVEARSQVVYNQRALELPTAPDVVAEKNAPDSVELQKLEIEWGDNLWTISRKLYGRGIRYTVIYDANRNQIRDPDLIYPGQVFVIPPDAEEAARETDSETDSAPDR